MPNSRCKIATHVGFALLLLLSCAAVGHAQSFAYVGDVDSDPCADPNQTGCTRGLIHRYNATSRTIAATFTIWQGVAGRALLDTAASADGQQLYVLERTSSSSVSLLVVDTTTGNTRPFGSAVGSGLLKLAPDGSRLLVLENSTLQVFDVVTEQLIMSIPSSVRSSPAGNIELTADGRTAYVAAGDHLDVFDLTGAGSVVRLNVTAYEVRLTPDNTRYILLASTQAAVFDRQSNQLLATLIPNGWCEARAMAVARERFYLFGGQCVDIGGGGVTIYDLQTLTTVGDVGVPSPFHATPTADESVLLVRSFFTEELFTLDTTTGTLQFSGIPSHLLGFPTVSPAPITPYAAIVIESPATGSAPLAQPFDLRGWAVDAYGFLGPGVDAVHVWAFPSAGGAPVFVGADYGRPRADIEALLGFHYLNSGFRVAVHGLSPGTYQLAAFGRSVRTGTFSLASSVSVAVSATPQPQMAIDSPREGDVVPFPLSVAGWSLDLAAATGPGIDAVHVWAYPAGGGAPVFAGAASLGVPRPDVGAIFGSQFTPSGFQLMSSSVPPGPYTFVVYGHDVLTGTFIIQRQVSATIAPSARLAIDTPQNGAVVTQPFAIAGWAIDSAAATGTGIDAVHVWAYPLSGGAAVFAASGALGGSRPDVAAVFGSQFSSSGFNATISGLNPAAYLLVAYGHSSVTGAFSVQQSLTVTVAAR